MTKLSIVLGVLALALAGTAVDAAETFTVTATFDDDFALGELSARLDFCTSTIMQSGTDAARADCVKNLISASAHCYSQAGEFLCNIGGVVINTKDISFQCAGGTCPSESALVADMDAAHNCAGSSISVAGFTAESQCYSSAYCLYKTNSANSVATTGFGEFCPSSTGEFCCSTTAARDNGYFQSANPVFSSTDASYRHIDHVVDMDFSIAYDVQAPAKLQLKVTVPYVTAASNITYVENGNTVTRTMCPTTYLIDFLPPVETEPKSGDGIIDPPGARVNSWLPLSHFPAEDLVGRPRTSCAAYSMNYGNAAAFNAGFDYPTGNSGDFTYGNVLATDAANWDTASGTSGIPYDTVTFWNKGAAPAPSDPQTIEYTVGDGPSGYFDLVRVWTQCKNLKSPNAQVVTKDAEVEDIYINGVRYEVESYSWTLSVCGVGWYGPQCDRQMYAKTCRSIPASFSVTPQQIAHVAIAPVTSQLVSKTFLQSVDAFPSDCAILSERVAVTLNLVIFGTDYEIKTDSVHDVLAPTGILDTVNQEDLTITSVTGFTDFASYAAAEATAGRAVPAGVYVMDKRTVSSGGTSVYYRKIVVVTKCYQTDYNPERGTRDSPSVFADAIAGSDDHVLFDVEVILSNTTGTSIGTDITNTLNLRVLATKETFVLPTASELKQKDATAYQALYGSYASAALDTAVNHPLRLPSGTQMRGGDQVCSKHQLVEADAISTNLIPNAVGSCMLKKSLPSHFVDKTGTTIKYKVPGGEVTDYTYGCFPDWIDVTGVDLVNGVYEFSGPVVRQSAGEVHDSIFWFVQKQELEETQLIAGEKMSDRFGTALFWFDMNQNPGSYVVTKSDQFQTSATSFAVNPSGCANTIGAQKSSCNLVCFDLVDSLLTDPLASSDRQVLVHHVSVATIANESHTIAANKLTGAKKHRRTLLESVTPTVRTSDSLSAGITTLAVAPGPKQVAVNAADDSGPRDVDGPKNFAAIFYPIAFVLIFASMTVVGCFCATRRYPTKSLFRSINAGSKRGGLEERLMGGR